MLCQDLIETLYVLVAVSYYNILSQGNLNIARM